MSKEVRLLGVVMVSLAMASLLVKVGFMALEEMTPPASFAFAVFVFIVAAAVPIVLIQKALREGSWSKD